MLGLIIFFKSNQKLAPWVWLNAYFQQKEFRDFLYSGTRFGVYDITKDVLGDTPENPLPLYLKVPASLFAGAVGATIGNPGDLCMVRMQADGKLPPELRRDYGHVFR